MGREFEIEMTQASLRAPLEAGRTLCYKSGVIGPARVSVGR